MVYDHVEQDYLDRSVFIHRTSVIYPGVVIENDVQIGPFCTIGARAEISEGLESHPVGRVVIKSGVRIEGHCTIDSGSTGVTMIGANCLLMKQTHVGHDAVLGMGVTLSPGARIGGEATVGEFSNVGMNAGVHQQTALPKKSMLGMLTPFTKKLAAVAKVAKTYVGASPRELGDNKKWL